MKTCDNCSNKDWCLITKPDRYYEMLIFNGASVCPKYKEKETDMKSCENCILNNTCVDYYAKNCKSQICEWYTDKWEKTHFCDECQDYANCDLVDRDEERGGKCCGDFREAESYAFFGYSDAQIHGETPYADAINNILDKIQKKYRVDIDFDGGSRSSIRDAIKVKIIDLKATSLLTIVDEDKCRYSYNLAKVISFKVTEEYHGS